MPRRVDILSRERVYDGFFPVDNFTLRFEKHDGEMSPEVQRLVCRRQDAVACVLWHRERERLILVEQFRAPTALDNGPGWTLELPAGMLDEEGETADETMIRELKEEVGYQVDSVRELLTWYPSPGGSSERLTLFYAEVTEADRIGNGGGVGEGEDLKLVEMSLDEILDAFGEGRLIDGKTIIGAQWLLRKMNR